jgi:hypothetical protein
MHNKSKSWTDVQLIISSFSIALTLGFWGIFASREKTVAGVTGQAVVPQQPDALVSSSVPALLPGQKLLFGGANPQVLSTIQPQTQVPPKQIIVPTKKHGGKGGGGGGGGGSPNAGTGSSHP